MESKHLLDRWAADHFSLFSLWSHVSTASWNCSSCSCFKLPEFVHFSIPFTRRIWRWIKFPTFVMCYSKEVTDTSGGNIITGRVWAVTEVKFHIRISYVPPPFILYRIHKHSLKVVKCFWNDTSYHNSSITLRCRKATGTETSLSRHFKRPKLLWWDSFSQTGLIPIFS